MRKKFIIGNWKMGPVSQKEAEKLFQSILKSIKYKLGNKVIVCPPFIYIKSLQKFSRKIFLGAQDSFFEDTGAYTGEISSEMLYDVGARYVILGHSERRSMGESNELVNKKIKNALKSGLKPILCIGENIRDENHEYLNFIKQQLLESLTGISKNSIEEVIIAYEPVWAIGKGGSPATAEEFLEMSIFIKKILADKFGVANVDQVSILYGGSVDEKNVSDFISIGQADGFLVGRASLNPKKFSKIIEIVEKIK